LTGPPFLTGHFFDAGQPLLSKFLTFSLPITTGNVSLPDAHRPPPKEGVILGDLLEFITCPGLLSAPLQSGIFPFSPASKRPVPRAAVLLAAVVFLVRFILTSPFDSKAGRFAFPISFFFLFWSTVDTWSSGGIPVPFKFLVCGFPIRKRKLMNRPPPHPPTYLSPHLPMKF